MLLSGLARPALAGNEGGAPAAELSAQEHFDEGLRAYEARDLATACSHFEQSYKLDPLPGVLFTLAACEARQGRVATGAARYREFLAMVAKLPAGKRQNEQSARVAAAQAELSRLETEIPKIRIQVASPHRGQVRLNGKEVPDLDQPMLLDPGEYTITLESESGTVEERRIRLQKGEDVRVELGKSARPAPPPPSPPPSAKQEASKTTTSDIVFYSAVGVAGVGLAVGTVTGVIALSADGCENGRCATKDDLTSAERARTVADVSTVAFIVGGVAASTALVVKLLSARSEPPPVALALHPRGLTVKGRF